MSQDFRARQTQTSQIISSGSSGTSAKIVFYDISAQSTVNPNQGIIDSTKFNTSSIGTDIFLYVSGGINKRDVGNSQAITVFGGDVHVSGNLSLAGFGNVATNQFRLTITDFASTTNTSSSPEVVGQAIFDGTQFSGSITLRAIVNSAVSGAIAVIKLFELTSASYVDIKGPSQQELAVTGTTPTVVESVNLYNANGFLDDGQGKYELRLFTATSGVAAFVGGAEFKPSGTFTNLTIVTQSFTTTFISGTTGFRLGFNDYVTTTNTSSNPTIAGQVIFPAHQFSGSLTFRAVLSTVTASQTASVRLFNVTSGAYVHLATGQTTLSTSNTTPTILTSQNLFGAVNFTTGSEAIYEMHLHTSTGSAAAMGGGGELRPSGSFTGVTIITSSTIFSSGTWVDNNNRLRTTASVAINTDSLFANQYGSDVYFYVSGTITSGSSTDKVSVFGGSVRVSGVLAVGPGTAFISGSVLSFTNADANTGAIFRVDDIADGSALVGLEADVTIAASSITASGSGGNLNIVGGNGGYTNALNGKHPGGSISLDAGTGGTIAGGGSNSGAGGGTITLVAGLGGDSLVGARDAGAGGNVQMFAGDGGQNLAVIGNGGNGGSVLISAGGGSAGVTSYGDGGNVEISSGNTFGVSGSPGSIRLLPGVNTADSVAGYIVFASSYNDERVQDAFIYVSGTIGTGSATSRNTVFQGSLITSGTMGFRNPQFPPGMGYISLDSSGELNFFDTNNPGGLTLSVLTNGGRFFFSNTNGIIEASGSLKITGSFAALSLSASNGANITGSLLNGVQCITDTADSHAEGFRTRAANSYAHAEGFLTLASGQIAHTEGILTTASSDHAHAEGRGTQATNTGSHAEGLNTIASGQYSHAEGNATRAFGIYSHAQGQETEASGSNSFAGGLGTVASGADQTVLGRYNKQGNAESLFIIGNGIDSVLNRRDIFLVNTGSILIGSGTLGRDVFLFVSGGINQRLGTVPAITLFGGDVHISGNLTVSGSGQGNDYWQSTANRIIFNTGSIRQGTAVTINTAATNSVALSSQGSSTLAGLSNAMLSTDASHIRNSSGAPSHVKSNTIASDTFSAIDGDSVIGNTQYNFIGAGFAHTVNSGAQYNAILGSVGFRVTSGSTACGALGSGDPTFTVASIFDNATVSAMIAGGPNTVSSSDGNPVQSVAVIGGNWTITSSFTYVIGDTINDARIQMSASRGVDITGQTKFFSGLSGSLTKLASGAPYLLAGPNVTLSTGSSGQITIGSVIASGSLLSLGITDYASTSNTSSSPSPVGQLIFDPNNFTGPIILRSALTSTSGTVTASLQLYNATSGAYVHIGGAGVTTLNTTNTTPTIVESVNLRNATNFATSSAIYELQIYTGTGSQSAIVGGAEFRITGAVTPTPTRLNLGSYTVSTATSSNPEAVGGGYFVPTEHNRNSWNFRAILYTTTGSNTAFVQLYNVTSGALVHIGGAGITALSSSATTPTVLQSVELLTATNFSPVSASIYEVRIYGSGSSPITTLVNSELVCT